MNWLVYAILGAVLAGVSPVFAKSGLHKSNAYLAAALRGTFLFLGAWFMVNRTGTEMAFSGIGSNTWMYLIFSGIATGLVWICMIRALQLGEVIKVVPVIEGSIILDMLVGVVLFHDALDWKRIALLILLSVGLLMMVIKSSGRGRKMGAWCGYAVGAAFFTMVTVVLARVGIRGVDSNFDRMIRYGIALLLVWLVVFATRGYTALRSMSFLDGIYLCISGAVMGGAWYCFSNTSVQMAEKFDLVAAVVLGCVFLRERLSTRAIIGMILMMLGFCTFL